MSKKRVAPKIVPPTWLKLIIPLFGFLLYANTFGHEYTQDDAIVITENEYTKKGVAGIPDLLSKDTFRGFFKVEGKSKLVSGGRYRPLTPVMFAIEYQIFGDAPIIGHIINALLYGLLGWLIFLSIHLICTKLKFKNDAWWIAAVCAALYLAHPLHTEAVANIKGRDEIMAMLGGISALYFALKYLHSKSNVHLILVGVLLFLGMMAKETAITFVLIIPLTYWFLKVKRTSWLPVALAGGIAAVVFIAIRTAVLGLDFGGTPMELLNNPFIKIENNQYVAFSFLEKSATIMYTLGKYLMLMCIPHPLTHDYYPRHIELMSWSNWQVILSFLAYLGLIFLAIKGWVNRKLYGLGIFYYLITLSIVSNIIFPIGTNMSERFLFMPSLGFALISAWLLFLVKRKWGVKAVYAMLAIVLLAYSIKTVTRNTAWSSNYNLFLTDVQTSTRSAKLLNSVGGEMITQSINEKNPETKKEMLLEAQTYLRRALEIHPNYKLAYLLMGNSEFYLENFDQSIKMFERVVALDPNYADGQKNLSVAYREAGKYRGEILRDVNGALPLLLKAYEGLPNDSETLRLLGVAYGRMGNTNKAIEYFEKELAVSPKNASSYFNLGITYQNMGNTEKAASYFEQAKVLDPEILNRNKPQNK